jgi:hypothetical protein
MEATMSELSFESMLKRMGEIAAAVNTFSSEAVQQAAFAALLEAAGGSVHTPSLHSAEPPTSTRQHSKSRQQLEEPRPVEHDSKAKRRKPREGVSSGKVEIIRDLNLRPEGKPSFADFVAQKQPKSNEDKYAVVVYYLEQILGLSAISKSHIASVFRMTSGWREPENISSGLKKAASRKSTIDTHDRSGIKTTPHGRNFVEHDLPASPKSR